MCAHVESTPRRGLGLKASSQFRVCLAFLSAGRALISFCSSPEPRCWSSGLLRGARVGRSDATSDGSRSCSGPGSTAALCLLRATSPATPGCSAGCWDLKSLHQESLCGHLRHHDACMLPREQQGFVVRVPKERCFIYWTCGNSMGPRDMFCCVSEGCTVLNKTEALKQGPGAAPGGPCTHELSHNSEINSVLQQQPLLQNLSDYCFLLSIWKWEAHLGHWQSFLEAFLWFTAQPTTGFGSSLCLGFDAILHRGRCEAEVVCICYWAKHPSKDSSLMQQRGSVKYNTILSN